MDCLKYIVNDSTAHKETAVFLMDSILVHADHYCGGEDMERVQRHFSPFVHGVFKRVLRSRSGRARNILADKLMNKIVQKWQSKDWFDSELVERLAQICLKKVPDSIKQKYEKTKTVEEAPEFTDQERLLAKDDELKAKDETMAAARWFKEMQTKKQAGALVYTPRPNVPGTPGRPNAAVLRQIPSTPRPKAGIPATPKAYNPLLTAIPQTPKPGQAQLLNSIPMTPRPTVGGRAIPMTPASPGTTIPPTPVVSGVKVPMTPSVSAPDITSMVPSTPPPQASAGAPMAIPMTPKAGAAPSTPTAPKMAIPMTPKAGAAPSTPTAPKTEAANVPSTAAGLIIPGTPKAAFPSGGASNIPHTPASAYGMQPAGTIPNTPAAAFRGGNIRMPSTPATAFANKGSIPNTPAGAFANKAGIPSTPAAAFGRTQSAGNIPNTPAAAFGRPQSTGNIPSTPAAAFGRPQSAGNVPRTPAGAFASAASRIPNTPMDAFARPPVPAFAPAGRQDTGESTPIPQTPAGLLLGASQQPQVPTTPATASRQAPPANAPMTPAGLGAPMTPGVPPTIPPLADPSADGGDTPVPFTMPSSHHTPTADDPKDEFETPKPPKQEMETPRPSTGDETPLPPAKRARHQ